MGVWGVPPDKNHDRREFHIAPLLQLVGDNAHLYVAEATVLRGFYPRTPGTHQKLFGKI